jgi:hypothetical protein
MGGATMRISWKLLLCWKTKRATVSITVTLKVAQ